MDFERNNQRNDDGSHTEVGWSVTGRLKPVGTNPRLLKARLSLHAELRPVLTIPDSDVHTLRSLLEADMHGGEQ